MREPNLPEASAHLALAHLEYCRALEHLARVISYLPNANDEACLRVAADETFRLEMAIRAGREALLAYSVLITRAQGEA
jgi:hypothetical protein